MGKAQTPDHLQGTQHYWEGSWTWKRKILKYGALRLKRKPDCFTWRHSRIKRLNLL
jgi:hypothetical protein